MTKLQLISMPDSVRELVHFQHKQLSRHIPKHEQNEFLVPVLENEQIIVWRSDPRADLTIGLIIGCILEIRYLFIKTPCLAPNVRATF